MSWGTCFSGSNNIHFNFPPIMADGRNYSSWQPSAVVNENIQKSENIHTNWDYRQFMTHHGIEIMKLNNREACLALGLSPHVHSDRTSSQNVPYIYSSTTDTSKPRYGYSKSDLKNPYLSREVLQSRLLAPSIKVTDTTTNYNSNHSNINDPVNNPINR
jgi:hypothetical protein